MATTNISALLLGELQSLCTEARRKHPDIKEAAERVIVILRGIKTTTATFEEIAQELSKSDEVIRPFVLACRSNNQRLISIAMHCLQQLVSRQAISPGSISETLTTLTHVSAQGVVDVQVKVLQMVLPLVTIYGDSVCGETLVEAFALCLALQRSRDPVVSNTAAAILRQVVVAVFDRVVAEDRKLGLPGTSEQDLTRKSAKDAYFVLQDLCLLVSDAEPIFIRIDHAVDKRLVLELIESVLTNHSAVVAGHSAMAQTLRERLAPFIVNFFAERASFSLAVRCIRIAWLFVRDLHRDLTAECEIILSVFSRLLDSGATTVSSGKRRASLSTKSTASNGFPLFYRVLALEVVRDLLENAPLLHQLYTQYDGRVIDESAGKEEDCHVILDLISAVCRVVIERANLRPALGGSSIPSALPENTLSAGDSGSTDMLGHQIGANTCRMRLEMYKLLDKQEPPNVPDTYMFYLAASAIISFSEGLVGDILPQCTEHISCPTQHSGSRRPIEVSAPVLGKVIAEPGAVGSFVKHSWAAVFPVYEFIAGVRFDDLLFARMLESARQLVETAGALGLVEARDSMLALLCRGCLPTTTQASSEVVVPNSRQVQCLRAVISCTLFLASTLRPAWYMVLATVQQVEEALFQSRRRLAASTPNIGSDDSGGSSDFKFVRDEFARLLGFVRVLNGEAVLWMIRGLRVLGSDLSGIVADLDEVEEMRRLRQLALGSTPGLQQRGNTLDRPTFAIEELRGFAVSNIDLLMGAASGDGDIGQQAWTAIIDHLLATATSTQAISAIRTQACEAVSDVVLAAMDLVTQADTLSANFQAMVESGSAQVRILRPLSQMMGGEHSVAVRKLTLDTLHRVLQASGHSITFAWDVVFDIIQSTVLGQDESGVLMRCVFPCLQLICTDYLADLSPGCLRRCISALLVQFGGQQDLNIALTAIGQAWALCDYFHGAKTGDPAGSSELISTQLGGTSEEAVFDELWREDLVAGTTRSQQVLWLLVLHALAQLGRDSRAEVRLGAIQTLFRAVDMHGPSSFDEWVWDGAVWAVILPLSQYALTQRAHVLNVMRSELPQPETDNGSGMVAEDPQRLLTKQWDETVAAAMLGAAKTWAYESVWKIGISDEAWRRVWEMTRAMFIGSTDAAEWQLRTKDSVAGALASARALASLLTSDSSSESWRTAWEAWVAMGLGATLIPPNALAEINIDDDDNVVMSQEVLCAVLELCPPIVSGLRSKSGLVVDDCDALLSVVRQILVFADAPMYSPDSAEMSRLQSLALDAVARALDSDSDIVAARVVDELAALSVLPYALKHKRHECVLMSDSAVVGAAGRMYLEESRYIERLEVLAGQTDKSPKRRHGRSRRTVALTFEALGRAAVGRLGAALCDDQVLALRVLESGAWLSAVVAMGLHLIQSDDSESWFVRTVPIAMSRLPSGPALDAAWMAIGSVVALRMNRPERDSLLLVKQGVLDAVAECSVESSATCPKEYWSMLLDAIEEGIVSDEDGLAMASLGWLERLCSIDCSVPEWVAASAAQRLVRRTQAIVDSYVADRTLFGHRSPLPLQRTLLLRRVLQGLAQLQSKGLDPVRGGSAAHIVAVFECLIGLVAESTADLQTARALQKCLRRVADEALSG
ncbi:Endocytosis and vacuole integrity protein [Coemansia aciculifera]|nr:Endocytosis and vacuole integrity protein [Coemansia aciculifera]